MTLLCAGRAAHIKLVAVTQVLNVDTQQRAEDCCSISVPFAVPLQADQGTTDRYGFAIKMGPMDQVIS